MEGNIVELFPSLKERPKEDPVAKFMESFVDFSNEHGIDTSTLSWRHNGAVIMSTLQGMLADR